MSELLVEFYSEEIPSNLQSDVRKQIFERLKDSLTTEKIIFKNIFVYSCPTRLTILIKDIKDKVKIPAREIRGPKVGVIDDVLNNFMRANNINKAQIFKRHTEKGDFYFFKKDSAIFDTKDLLIKELLNIISSLRWKKSMRWSNSDLHWGRPLRSIMAIYNGKILKFNYGHLNSKDFTIIEENSIDLRYYSIIYEVIDDIRKAISGLLSPDVKEEIIGLAEVKEVFRSSKLGAIAGCMVIEGTVRRSAPIRVLRENVVIYEGELESLRRHKDDVNDVKAGTECGIGVKNYNDVKEGDQIEVFERTEVAREI